MDNQVVEVAVTMATLGAWALEEAGQGACTENSFTRNNFHLDVGRSFFFFLYRGVFAYS